MTNTELRNVSALYNPMSLGNFTDLVIPQVRSENAFLLVIGHIPVSD